MTSVRFLGGIVLAALTFGPIGLGAHAVRRRFLAAWSAGTGALATLIIGLGAFTLIAQLLGVVGWLHLVPTVVTCVVVGAAATWWGRGHARGGDASTSEQPDARRTPKQWSAKQRREFTITGVVIALALGSWISRVAGALAEGMTSYDTLWYHLPTAVRFFQTGDVMGVHFTSLDPDMAFFPFNSEILHATGMMLFGSDIASPLINLGWFVVALVAAAAIGRSRGIPHITMLAVTAVYATPTMVNCSAGTAYTESMSIALLICAVAFYLEGTPDTDPRARLVLTGLAGGLALGTKFTLLLPVGLLFLCVVAFAGRGHRVRSGAHMLAGLIVGGSFWYVRNLVVFGNPLPSLKFALGPVKLPYIEGLDQSSFAHYIFRGWAWRDYFLGDFTQRLGPLWPLLAVLVALPVVVAFRSNADHRLRAITLTGLGAALAFIVTPQHIGNGGVPDTFALNIRYIAPALCVGLLGCALVFVRQRAVMFATFVMLVLTSQISFTSWGLHGFGDPISELINPTRVGVGIAAAVMLSAAVVVYFRPAAPPSWASGPRLCGGGLIVVLVVLGFARGPYLSQRYQTMPLFPSLYRWTQTQSDQRIVLEAVGYRDSINGRPGIETWVQRNILRLHYPFAGRDLSNWNQMAIFRHGTVVSGPRTCEEWLGFLRDNRATRAVVWAQPDQAVTDTDLGRWTAALPGARVILRSPILERPTTELDPSVVYVFRIDPDRIGRRC